MAHVGYSREKHAEVSRGGGRLCEGRSDEGAEWVSHGGQGRMG